MRSEVVKTVLMGFLLSSEKLQQTGKMWSCSNQCFLTRCAERVGLIFLQQHHSAHPVPVNVYSALEIAGVTEERVREDVCWTLLFFTDLQALQSKGDRCSPEDKIKNQARFSRLFHSTLCLRCRRVLLVCNFISLGAFTRSL